MGEMIAILFAVLWIGDTSPLKAIIRSDSSSSFASLHCSHSERRLDILIETLQALYRIQTMGLTVFVWVPAHRRLQKEIKLVWQLTSARLNSRALLNRG